MRIGVSIRISKEVISVFESDQTGNNEFWQTGMEALIRPEGMCTP
jgi:uncharacterized protein (DUF4415 family)